MASLLPAHARITATDLNQQMLSQAMARQSEDPRLAWKQADALTLPFEDQSFNVVACQFGVMFFPDKVRGYKEAYRVLRPGGRFFFNVWDRISKNEFADVITDALAMVFPQDPPRFLAQTSYGYFHKRTIRVLGERCEKVKYTLFEFFTYAHRNFRVHRIRTESLNTIFAEGDLELTVQEGPSS